MSGRAAKSKRNNGGLARPDALGEGHGHCHLRFWPRPSRTQSGPHNSPLFIGLLSSKQTFGQNGAVSGDPRTTENI